MERRALPFEAPEGVLFTLKDLTYSPEQPREKVPFTVKGKIELFKIPFVAPIWVIAKVTYPESWWEEIIPIIGGPTISEGATVFGGNFEITFPRGFDREGEFILEVEAYAGPTFSFDKMKIPPFPPVASEKTTFIVAGEVPEEELGFRNFRILSYAKNGGTPVTPSGVLELDVGDRLQIKLGFDHRDLAVTGKIHAAIWQETFVDPHDEVLNKEKTFSVLASDDWEPHEEGIEIIITSDIAPGTEYGLYAKIMGITGGDIFTEYLANVITIVGPPPEADIKDFDFKLTKGTYDIGDKVSFTAPYDYKGIAQDGQLTISIGTGIQGTFITKHTYSPVPVRFEEAIDWETRGLEGSIVLPDIFEQGQMYNVRAKLETLEKKTQETDTDWSAFDIKGIALQTLEVDITEPHMGYVTTEPGATEGHPEDKWYNNDTGKFEYDTKVRVTAHPNEGYKFDHWSDEIEGGVSYSNPEYVKPMTEHRAVKAHFREIEIELELLEVKFDPYGAGYVTTDPEPESGTEYNWYFPHGTTVYVTAHPNPGYRFKSWSGEMKDTTAITAPVYPMTEKRTITAHFEEEEVEEYALTITPDPPGSGTVTKSPDKTKYTYGEFVTLTATPSSGYKFDRWSGDASGYSTSITIAMTRDKSVTARFKAAIPDPTTIVSFTVKGDGFPFLTSYWKLYHYDRDGNVWQDYTLHRPGDIINVRNVKSAGRLSCHCVSAVTGEWSEQFYSVDFAAIDGEDYRYDIASGMVYYR